MRAVVQRVKEAHVTVDGQEIGRIDHGLLVYLGIGETDQEQDITYLAAKVAALRIFQDEKGAMNRSVQDLGGQALVISQFTLFGDVRRGRRPSFTQAMDPKKAKPMYEQFAAHLETLDIPTAKGQFGAMMQVHAINDGPVTILLDSQKVF